MRRFAAPLAAVLALATGCASAPKVTTWKNPDVGPVVFKKLAVFAFAVDPAVRRTVENSFARSLSGESRATPSYTFVNGAELKDKDAVLAKIKAGGYDGIVAFRLIAIDEHQKESYAVVGYSSPYYAGWGGYYGTYGVSAYGTTYSTKEQIVQIETTAYAVDGEKLAWAAQTQLQDPKSTLDVIDEIVGGAVAGMKKDGLIR